MKIFSARSLAASSLVGAILLGPVCATANDPYERIIADQQSGRYDQALTQISNLLKSNENDAQALLLKGNVTKLMGDTAAATDIFKQLIAQYPQMPEAYNNLAVLYADKGETALAIETLQQVFSTSDSYATAYKNLRTLYDQMASSAYRDALDIAKTPKSKAGQFALLNKTLTVTVPSQVVAVAADQVDNLPIQSAKVTEPQAEIAAVTSERPAQDIKTQAPDVKQQISTMIGHWSQAWSQRKVQDYFAFYHPTFKPPQSMSRKRWENSRGKRLTRPKFINIEIVGMTISPRNDSTATAIFEQHYRSDSYQDTVVKRLVLKKSQDKWLIVQEIAL